MCSPLTSFSKGLLFPVICLSLLDAPPLPPNPRISSTAQKHREPVLEETTAANTQTSPTQKTEYAVLEGPTHPKPKTSTDHENEEGDDSFDPAHTEEQDPISLVHGMFLVLDDCEII